MASAHTFSRRVFVASGGVAVLGALAACRGRGGSDGDSDAVKLRFSWWGNQARYDLTQAAIDKFVALHPNISVEMEFAPFGDYFDKLATVIAGGDLPDLFQVTDPYMYTYIAGDVLQDLTQVEELDLSGFSESSLFATTVGGGVYGVPAGESGFAIIANPEVFEQAGVPMPDDETWSWQDYIDTAAAVTAALPDVVGSQIQWDEQMFTTYVRQQGADLWLADGSDIGFTAAEATEWFELLIAMRDSGGFPSPDAAMETVGLSIEQMPIANGTGAMQLVPFGQLPAAEANAGASFELLKFPGEAQGEMGMYTKPGIFYALAPKSAHRAEAAMLIDFLVNDPEAAMETGFDRGIPSNPEVLAAIEPELTDAEQRIAAYVARIQEADPKPFPHQNAKAGPMLVTALNRYQQDVLFGNLTPQQAGEQFVAEIQAAL